MYKLATSIVLLFCVATLVAQKSEIAGYYLEKVTDIEHWDSLMVVKLSSYDGVVFENLSSGRFEAIIMDKQVQLVDVRTKEEYAEGHIEGAVLIDVKLTDFAEKAEAQLDKQIPVAVYCRGGVRSRRAAEILLFRGFRVYNLDRGFDQWKKDGKKI